MKERVLQKKVLLFANIMQSNSFWVLNMVQ